MPNKWILDISHHKHIWTTKNKQQLPILSELYIRDIQPKLNKINFETSTKVFKCF